MTQFIVPGLLEMMYQLKIKMTNKVQQTTAIAETTMAETTTIEDKFSEKTTVFRGN